MRLKQLVMEDFTNYKKPSMVIGTISCDGKCCREAGIPLSVCQNDALRDRGYTTISDQDLCTMYFCNDITEAIIFGGLEPFEQFSDMYSFIKLLRTHYQCTADVVIYTGYYPDEILEQVEKLSEFPNIIIKFGRYIPNSKPKFDEVLGVELASDNQFAVKIS